MPDFVEPESTVRAHNLLDDGIFAVAVDSLGTEDVELAG